MTSVSIRLTVMAAAGAILLAACGVSSTEEPTGGSASTGKSGGASREAVVAELGSDLKSEPPQNIEPPVSKDGLPPVLRSIKTDDKVVFLTIDDGGTADPKVTEIIRRTGIPVTPFQTVNVTSANKAYFKQISEMTGQVIQNHTISHPQLPTMNLAGQEKQMCSASDDYQKWFGARPWMLRPPYGEYNETTREAAKNCGLSYIVLWNVSLPAAYLRYAQGDSLKSGDIILTHWRPDLYKHLPRALKDIKRQGFKVAALQDYLPAPV